jgi:hypothetical protein
VATFAPGWSKFERFDVFFRNRDIEYNLYLTNVQGSQVYPFLSISRRKPGGEWESAAGRLLPVREMEKAYAQGPLKMAFQRDGNQLFVQMNSLEPVIFEEIFPLDDAPGKVEFNWPTELAMEKLEWFTRNPPAVESALADADQLYADGKLNEAEAAYDAAAAANLDNPVGWEARYKQGLCMNLGRRPEDALRVWSDAAATGNNAWSLLADIQRLRLLVPRADADDYPLVDGILERLAALAESERKKIATKVTYAERQELTDAATRHGVHWLLDSPQENVARCRRIDTLNELFGTLVHRQLYSKAALIRAHRMVGDDQQAEQLARSWLGDFEAHCTPEALYSAEIHNELAWMNIERGRETAMRHQLTELQRWIYEYPDKMRGGGRMVIELLIPRARLESALGLKEKAQQSLAEYLKFVQEHPEPTDEYDDYAEAHLLLGWLEFDSGNEAAARDIWNKGTWNAWATADRGVEIRYGGGGAQAVKDLMLCALGEEKPSPESLSLIVKAIFAQDQNLTGGPLARGSLVAQLVPSLNVTPETILAAWSSPRAREWSRRAAYRQLSATDFVRTPFVLSGIGILRQQAFQAGLSDAEEEVLWQLCQLGLDAFHEKKISKDQVLLLVPIWKGYDLPGIGWDRVGPGLPAEMRHQAAYVLGARYQQLKLATGKKFFQQVVDGCQDAPLKELAQTRLDSLAKPAEDAK